MDMPAGDSSDTPEPTDKRIYEAHEQVNEGHQQVEDDPEDLHYEVGDIIEEARRAEQQGDKQYHRQGHERSGQHASPPSRQHELRT